MKKVLVTEPIHPDGLAVLEQHPDIEMVCLPACDQASLLAAVGDAHGMLVRTATIDAAVIAAAPELAVVSRHGVGCDNIAVAALNARSIPMAIAASANSTSVAEHVIMMMMVLAKNPFAYHQASTQGRFHDRGRFRMTELAGKTMLIIGFGRIGRKLAPLCKAFGMRVVVADLVPDTELALSLGCEPTTDFKPWLAQADFVSVHVPLDEQTRNLIDAPELTQMPEHAILINCARGGIVNEAALARVMLDGKLAGLGTDVFEQEPPQPDDPMLSLPNTILTPHAAALTEEGKRRMAVEAAQNIVDCFAGRLGAGQLFNAAALGL